MTLVEMISVNCEKLRLSRKEFADKCGIPVELIAYLEDPQKSEERLIDQCAAALGVKVAVFRGEELPEPTFREKLDGALATARFPNLRQFLLDPAQCMHPEKSVPLFASDKVSLAERNLILHLSTNALYRFCETSSSSFRFEEYLFRLHTPLFTRYEQEAMKLPIPDEEKQDLIDTARKNIFACDTMENIAIRIVEPFAEEFEEKLKQRQTGYADDIDLPLRWDFDGELMKISILGPDGRQKCEIKLLTVKERDQHAKPAG